MMRNGTLALVVVSVLTAAACVRTVVVQPEPRPAAAPPPPPRSRPPVPQPPPPPPPQTQPPAPTLGLPHTQLPAVGECRVWPRGWPVRLQPLPAPRVCMGILNDAPRGGSIIYRPRRDQRLVHIRVLDVRRPGVVTIVRIFDIESGRWLRDVRPEDEPQDDPVIAIQPPMIGDRPSPPPAPPSAPPAPPPAPPAAPPSAPPPAPPSAPPAAPPPAPPAPPPAPPAAPPPAPPAAPPPASGVRLHIPPGHLPELGECRIWIQGMPPGRQPRPKSRTCDDIAGVAPAGSWILYRPANEAQLLHVRMVDERRAGVVVRVRVFDIESEQLVREETP